MCLNRIRPNLKKEISKLEVHSDGYIWLWKAFHVTGEDCLEGVIQEHTFYEGKNTASGGHIGHHNYRYPAGFHCYVSRRAARNWFSYTQRVKVRKSWITTIGAQEGTVIVCKHIII